MMHAMHDSGKGIRLKISPSILSADFGSLNKEISEIEDYCESLHIDVMDGHFVPNITFGPVVIKHIKTKLPMDCHLMIDDPVKYAKRFSQYCKRIFFHAEIFKKKDLAGAINYIKKLGVDVGLALNPDKSLSLITGVLEKIDAVLIMSVYAGFAGQEFIPDVLEKIAKLRKGLNFRKDILIDGGINKKTIRLAKGAGANVFVSGSAIFKEKDRKSAIASLRKALC